MCDVIALDQFENKGGTKFLMLIIMQARLLSDVQLNYSTTENELLAFVFFLEKFR